MPRTDPPIASRPLDQQPVLARGPPIVGIGASAGGLDALTQLVRVLPADGGSAYIIVQHLDPTHKSLMAELLARHTEMPVLVATNGTALEPDHIYIIPAGCYLSVSANALRLSTPTAPHGARMPVDFLFGSLAKEGRDRTIAIILTGTGTDGTVGASTIHDNGGFVIAQDPSEAEYDGMPQSAIDSLVVDAVLTVAAIPSALAARQEGMRSKQSKRPPEAANGALASIIDLLRQKTAHDFTLYKMGTLQRRIERRMALSSIPATNMSHYLVMLEADSAELNLLATDLLINVTSFFRDPKVFDLLAKTIIPDIVRLHPDDRPLRIWIAGCSTGEETYSLAILFTEAIAAAKRTIKLCVFASDVDPDAVAIARTAHYPESIATDVSAEILARFFKKEDQGFSVIPELRADVVFTLQDLLSDPPFSRLDLVSCRNVLIYLGPEAQAKAISLFHFALLQGGILLLGSSETVSNADAQFEIVAKSERIYRRVGKNRPGAALFLGGNIDGLRLPLTKAQGQSAVSRPGLADLCRRLLLENHAPAAVMMNRRHECLYSMGPTERYLRVAQGHPTHDLLAMAAPGLRTKLRAAIGKVSRAAPHVAMPGGRAKHGNRSQLFDIDIRSVMHDGEELLLVAFIDQPPPHFPAASATRPDSPRIAELEHELDIARNDLSAAIHDLESSGEEHRAINEEALSVNEEYQSANEELLTSKEELQSLNEELTALNGQLQETLERQRTTSNDLQNVLYSTNVATLFLDANLKVRFFTPTIKALFNLIPGDIGRPIADLHPLSDDKGLIDDARSVLANLPVSDHEIEVEGNIWFMRRILPYRTDGGGVEGVVTTYVDITERKTARKALETAKREAEQANLAKSRFLAAASHDLRQPLQSLALLQGLLVAKITDEGGHRLLDRFEQSLTTMSSMLNTMLDINQIEAGVVRAAPADFVIGDLIARVMAEFFEQAHAQKLDLSAVYCSRIIHSDQTMIEQMLRNLVANALKYTKRGKILIGCRQQGEMLRIEVWDTGIGIAASELEAIFEEYHQVDNVARDRSLGLGLGLSLVQRLARLLGHQVRVRSLLSHGSVFSIEVFAPRTQSSPAATKIANIEPALTAASHRFTGTILVIDDDVELCALLAEVLRGDGHSVFAAHDRQSALAMVGRDLALPDMLLIDYNLPGGLNGLQLATKIGEKLGYQPPTAILTGDIASSTMRDVSAQGAALLNKPVKIKVLRQVVERSLMSASKAKHEIRSKAATIYVVDDDSEIRSTLRELLEADGRHVEDFGDSEAFLAAYDPHSEACLLIDAYLPGIDGIELLRQLKDADHLLPAIMITGSSAVPMAVDAMKVGAIDFLEKPVRYAQLITSIDHALGLSRDTKKLQDWRSDAAAQIGSLTARQHQVMELILAGHPNKNIATDLNISQRTVENHRAAIMRKTGAKSLPALARLALAAGGLHPPGPTIAG